MRRRRLLATAVAALLWAGCPEIDQETSPEALEAALAGLRGPDATTRATADPLPSAGSEPHQARQVIRLQLTPDNGNAARLVVSRTIARGPEGRFHIRDERVWQDTRIALDSAEDGAEVVFDGKRLAVRRDGGPWMERETLGGQEERLLRNAYDAAPTLLEALGPYLVWRPSPPGDPARLGGMDLRWEDASLDPQVRPRPMALDALAALRDHEGQWGAWLAATHRPTEVSAHIGRRTQGGQPVAGQLRVVGDASVEGVTARFELELTLQVADLPPGERFEVPEAALSAQRDRPWSRIRSTLGDDLLAPYRPD
ncbi:MAG: hypothetical protein H6746_15335 [Deltaproteobacteria bacterium]|nr:hypothetical protein [Deltaproteobacteria bacterium]